MEPSQRRSSCGAANAAVSRSSSNSLIGPTKSRPVSRGQNARPRASATPSADHVGPLSRRWWRRLAVSSGAARAWGPRHTGGVLLAQLDARLPVLALTQDIHVGHTVTDAGGIQSAGDGARMPR